MPKYLRHAQSTFLGKLLFLRDTRAQFANVYIQAHSSKLLVKLQQKCGADGAKKRSRRPVFPVKSTVSKEEERNCQWKRGKCSYKQFPSRAEKPVERGKN